MSKKRNWRGYATFEMPDGGKVAVMTVCPGNPDQEGQRFRAIMQAAGALLDKLYIIEAADLGFHNLKRFVPKNDARAFARLRGERWLEAHREYINESMDGCCTVVPMRDIVCEPTFDTRVEMIREIYDRGNNPVTEWFDYSANLDVEARAERKKKEGVIIEPWAIKENSLGYLCDEYAMRSLMWEKFGLPEIYLGLAVKEAAFFQKQNLGNYEIDLTIPQVVPIMLQEVVMIHNERLGRSFPSNDTGSLPPYAARQLGLVHRG
jgi:hypothetical protein